VTSLAGDFGRCRLVSLRPLSQLDVKSAPKVVSTRVQALLFEAAIIGVSMSFPTECSSGHKSGGEGQEAENDA
jgi:hypothetical protein